MKLPTHNIEVEDLVDTDGPEKVKLSIKLIFNRINYFIVLCSKYILIYFSVFINFSLWIFEFLVNNEYNDYELCENFPGDFDG